MSAPFLVTEGTMDYPPDDYVPQEHDSGRNDLFSEMESLRHRLDPYVEEFRRSGTAFAEADRAYHVAKTTEALRLKAEGMSATLIAQVIKGMPDVAEARFEMIRAQELHRADLEGIQSTKLQMKTVNDQISREWSNPQAGF